ncbi:hypothetical protein T4A_702 [Trichinella pseudospiralis]|uniref:Uncharacterized protein n=1 Tax=Trichinella pseudospiralis TaxID=6337 RepID=A0A0V1E5V8_TRIPS|nr:hypothetical protein T4A_702 [Trichinella pseudospiralis]
MAFLAREKCCVRAWIWTLNCGTSLTICNFNSYRNLSTLHSIEQLFQQWYFVNLKSVEGAGFACLKKKGAAESETGSSVLFGSVKGLRDSTDSADGTFGSWQLKCTFGCCWCCHWPEMEWKKLHQIEENIKQISEHKQLTTLDNVDCRISNVSKLLPLRSVIAVNIVYSVACLRCFCLPCCAAKPFLSTLNSQRMSAFRQPTEPNQNCNLSSLQIVLLIINMRSLECYQRMKKFKDLLRRVFKIILDFVEKNELVSPIGV